MFLASAELSAVTGILGRIPTMAEYMEYMKNIETMSDDIYRYLNFHEIAEYKDVADKVIPIVAA